MYIAIVTYDTLNRVTKYQSFVNQQDANDFVTGLDETKFPDAFADVKPEGGYADWLIDPVTKTVSYSPDIEDLKERCFSLIRSAMIARVHFGIRWGWGSEEPEYSIKLDPEMREILASWHQLLNQSIPATNPHGGFVKSNGIIIKGPGSIDIPDAAINELAEFAGLWVSEISRVAINEELIIASMSVTQLQSYDASSIDWSVTWSGHVDWIDDLVLYNP